jgi:hypothetical protein
MDTNETQFVVQDFYNRFVKMTEYGESIWKKINLDKKRIVWLNPYTGFSIAALKDIHYEIKRPSAYTTYEENFAHFKSLWMKLDFEVKLLYENIEAHLANNE